MTTSQKDRKRAFPDIPQPLAVPIVDNHTHIRRDPPVGPDGVMRQACNEAGMWKPPLLLSNLLEAMERCGVRAAITSGCEWPEWEWTVELARQYPQIWAAIAIHPNEAAMHMGVREIAPDGLEPRVCEHHAIDLDTALARVAELVRDDAVCAVGETGLDYFRTGPAGREAQVQAFRAHIELAKDVDKPMQIHDRDAHEDVVDVLRADGAPSKTVFHCFSGDVELAQICRENGWYGSFGGSATYPANTAIRQAFCELPDELILLETDAPYLTPVPFRGHPNAPWAVVYTAQFLADLRGMDVADFCALVDENTRCVYGI
ncbi:TatD family hydrolase [Trueperella sp. LYQ143]|uniref:TatD family hydrolase n=1 Tax=unclassified Trueperella TaxID=2630174 RepID=UPI003983B0CB